MTKDFKRFYVSRAMSLGATMFLASIGMASANPSTDTFGSDEPNPVVASPQQAKHSIKGVVEDALGPIAGANVVEKELPTVQLPTWTVIFLWKYLLIPSLLFLISDIRIRKSP